MDEQELLDINNRSLAVLEQVDRITSLFASYFYACNQKTSNCLQDDYEMKNYRDGCKKSTTS